MKLTKQALRRMIQEELTAPTDVEQLDESIADSVKGALEKVWKGYQTLAGGTGIITYKAMQAALGWIPGMDAALDGHIGYLKRKIKRIWKDPEPVEKPMGFITEEQLAAALVAVDAMISALRKKQQSQKNEGKLTSGDLRMMIREELGINATASRLDEGRWSGILDKIKGATGGLKSFFLGFKDTLLPMILGDNVKIEPEAIEGALMRLMGVEKKIRDAIAANRASDKSRAIGLEEDDGGIKQ